MNGFEKHGLTHSSISQINKWIAAPDAWVSHYLFGNRGSGSSAMWRGIFVEEAVADVITGRLDAQAAICKAIENFDNKIILDDDGSADKERNNIPLMTFLAVDALRPYGKPDLPEGYDQHKVSMTAKGDDWSLDFIGFLDFRFPDHGLIVDLKTTMRMPSKMTIGHQRQRAFYSKASGNTAVKFLYVTPKKCEFKEDGDPTELMAEIKAHLSRQEKFLSMGDKETLRDIVPVNPDSFYWRGDEAVRTALYGL